LVISLLINYHYLNLHISAGLAILALVGYRFNQHSIDIKELTNYKKGIILRKKGEKKQPK